MPQKCVIWQSECVSPLIFSNFSWQHWCGNTDLSSKIKGLHKPPRGPAIVGQLSHHLCHDSITECGTSVPQSHFCTAVLKLQRPNLLMNFRRDAEKKTSVENLKLAMTAIMAGVVFSPNSVLNSVFFQSMNGCMHILWVFSDIPAPTSCLLTLQPAFHLTPILHECRKNSFVAHIIEVWTSITFFSTCGGVVVSCSAVGSTA